MFDTTCDALVAKGRYRTRLAETDEDLLAAQSLRHRAFRGAPGRDVDPFDAACAHMLVEDIHSGALVCTFRFLLLETGDGVEASYSAQYYDLSGLKTYPGPLLEIGRFCIDPNIQDPDVLRIAWGALAAFVDRAGVTLLFGCASFAGTEHAPYEDAFAVLKARHLGPKRWLPHIKAPKVFHYAARLTHAPDLQRAMQVMPPLLKTYLMMGGWVSDHAVVDPKMNTLHVFTGVEIGLIPPARKRLLRALAS